ncbi:MAG: iron-sulfur cluster assembly accessory protein [Pseudomonadota bacterium]
MLPQVTLTDAALNQVREMLKETNEKSLRAYFEGCGCAGLQIQIKVDGEVNPDDTVIVLNDAIQLIADPVCLQYLIGETINYLGEGELARFVVENMKVRAGCPGCGH